MQPWEIRFCGYTRDQDFVEQRLLTTIEAESACMALKRYISFVDRRANLLTPESAIDAAHYEVRNSAKPRICYLYSIRAFKDESDYRFHIEAHAHQVIPAH